MILIRIPFAPLIEVSRSGLSIAFLADSENLLASTVNFFVTVPLPKTFKEVKLLFTIPASLSVSKVTFPAFKDSKSPTLITTYSLAQ